MPKPTVDAPTTAEFDALAADEAALQARVATAEARIADTEASLAALAAKNPGTGSPETDARLGAAETKIANAQARIGTAENTIGTQQTRLDEIGGKTADASARVAAVEARAAKIEAALAEGSAVLDDLVGQVDITVDDSAPDHLNIRVAMPKTASISRRLVIGGLATLLSTTALARPTPMGGGRGPDDPITAPPPNAANSISVANRSGTAQTNYPLQFGRGFLQGEISNYPQMLVGGTPVPTQANVKTRYPDGSIKHAAISAVVPSIPSSGSLALTFQNQLSGNDAALSRSDMLASGFNFDATMSFAFPAMRRGIPETTIATWQAVTNGSLSVVVDGTSYAVTGISFAGLTTLLAITNAINTALAAAAVPAFAWVAQTYGYPAHSYIISTATGAGHTIALATPASGTDIGPLLLKTGAATLAGSVASVSARTMLAAGHYTVRHAGPIAQTVEIADHSAARTYDVGNGDGFRPLRPRFYATFWPGSNKVFVRCVAENGLTSELEDLLYSATITVDQTSPRTVYSVDLTGASSTRYKHNTLTTWNKSFWIGGAPEEKININHNLPYLAETKVFPNYDTSITIPEEAISTNNKNLYAYNYGYWATLRNDIYDGKYNLRGLWREPMGDVGARDDIAPYPGWAVAWMYTGDWRHRKQALNMADLSTCYPYHLRETVAARRLSRLDTPGASTGLGRTVSITDRKTSCYFRFDTLIWPGTLVGDRVTVVGPMTQNWSVDGAHQPSLCYPQYVLTADPFYLDEMYAWAGYSAGLYPGYDHTTGRGPTGAEGVVHDQLRGAGWCLRNRVETADIAPDSDPEKAYFTYLTVDTIAAWEGGFGITGTTLDGDPSKVWGANTCKNYWSLNGGPQNGRPPTLRNWESLGNPTNVAANPSIGQRVAAGYLVAGAVGSITSPWMQHYDQYALGRARELGFPIAPVMLYSGKWLTDMLLVSGEPKLVANYQAPVEKAGGGFMTWPEVVAAHTDRFLHDTTWPESLPRYFDNNLHNEGRQVWATAGLAMLVDARADDAAAAWAWWLTNVYTPVKTTAPAAVRFDKNPKWAIVPRA